MNSNTNQEHTMTTTTTRVPYNLTRNSSKQFVPGRGDAGWTVREFATARDAARFVAAYPEAAMPCWQRFSVVAGELVTS